MIRIAIIAGFLLLGVSEAVVAQTIIAQWNINANLPADLGSTSSPVTSIGAGSLQLIGGTTGAYASGVSSSDPVATNPPNYSWETTNYPLSLTAEKTAGIQINVSTVGFNTISMVFDQRLSNTSANAWVVFYTADVTAGSPVWVEHKTFPPVIAGDTWYNSRTVDFIGVAALTDNPNVAFKIVSAYDPTTGDYKSSKPSSGYAGGKVRFDMITVSGIPNVIVQNDPPTASAVSETGILAIGDTLRAAYTYADAEGDDEGTSIFKWYSAADGNGANEVQIGGEDTLIYVITANDLNKFISFEVTPVALTGGSPGISVKSSYAGPVLDLGDPSVIKINEVYTRGLDTNPNPDLHADWIEFYNPGPKGVTLAGLRICDSGACELLSLDAYAQLIVPAGGFLALAEDQLNSFTFGLSSLGEFVALRHFDNTLIDSMAFPALEDTVSFGRYPDGSPNVFMLVPPTKAAPNAAAGVEITGVEFESLQMRLFPNPASSTLTVEAGGNEVIQHVSLFSVTGQEVVSQASGGSNVQVSISGLSSGFYLVRTTFGSGKSKMHKLLKE